jgi:hypothetical protein
MRTKVAPQRTAAMEIRIVLHEVAGRERHYELKHIAVF